MKDHEIDIYTVNEQLVVKIVYAIAFDSEEEEWCIKKKKEKRDRKKVFFRMRRNTLVLVPQQNQINDPSEWEERRDSAVNSGRIFLLLLSLDMMSTHTEGRHFRSNQPPECQPNRLEMRLEIVDHIHSGDIEAWRNWIPQSDKRIVPVEKREGFLGGR